MNTTPTLFRVCCYCNTPTPPPGVEVTHGCCAECFAKLSEEFPPIFEIRDKAGLVCVCEDRATADAQALLLCASGRLVHVVEI